MTTFFILALLTVTMAVTFGLIMLSGQPKFGAARLHLGNPVFLYGFFSIFQIATILILVGGSRYEFVRYTLYYNEIDLLYSSIVFAVLHSTFFAGCVTAYLRYSPTMQDIQGQRVFANSTQTILSYVFFAMSLAMFLYSMYPVLIQSFSNILSSLQDRFNAFAGSNVVIYAIASFRMALILISGLLLYRFKMLLPFLLFCALMMFFTGTRANVFIIFMVFLAAILYRGYRLPGLYSFLISPVIILLSNLMLYVMRAYQIYPNFFAFLESRGGLFEVFLMPGSIGSGIHLTTIISYDLVDKLHSYFGEIIIFLLMFPIPREVATSKPVPTNILFTQETSPSIFAASASQTTIGGYAEVFVHFGLIPGALMMAVLGYVFTRLSLYAIRERTFESFATLPILMYVAWHFQRTGLSQIAQVVWPLLVFLCIVWLAGKIRLRLPGRMEKA